MMFQQKGGSYKSIVDACSPVEREALKAERGALKVTV